MDKKRQMTLMDTGYNNRIRNVWKLFWLICWLRYNFLLQIAWLLNLRGSDIQYNPVFFSYVLIDMEKVMLFVDKTQVIIIFWQECKRQPTVALDIRVTKASSFGARDFEVKPNSVALTDQQTKNEQTIRFFTALSLAEFLELLYKYSYY